MEEQKKNLLGNIYGSRISKNGKWLNLLIVTHVDGKETRITCPVRLNDDCKHAYAFTELDAEGATSAKICRIPVYDDVKPSKAQAEAEDCGLPF